MYTALRSKGDKVKTSTPSPTPIIKKKKSLHFISRHKENSQRTMSKAEKLSLVLWPCVCNLGIMEDDDLRSQKLLTNMASSDSRFFFSSPFVCEFR